MPLKPLLSSIFIPDKSCGSKIRFLVLKVVISVGWVALIISCQSGEIEMNRIKNRSKEWQFLWYPLSDKLECRGQSPPGPLYTSGFWWGWGGALPLTPNRERMDPQAGLNFTRLMRMRSNVTHQQDVGFKASVVPNVIYGHTSSCEEKSPPHYSKDCGKTPLKLVSSS